MTYYHLANYFEQLESTSSRLSLIEILSKLFKETDKDNIDKIIYLVQGRIAPFYAPVEIGMAEKNVAAAIARAYGVERDVVLKEYDKLGDMGLAAQMFAESEIGNRKSGIGKMTVEKVFETLCNVAQISGDGTVEKKTTLLCELLQSLDPVSVKHLVRVPLGNTRLGVGDPTVLDALAVAILGDKSQRKLLEKAYNETSDLGLIGKTLLEHGLKDVQKLGVTVGRPIRSELCERLPNPTKVIEKMGKVHATPKYDGFRVQIHKNGNDVHMFSRNLEEMTHMFPELIAGTLKQIKARTVILDSEAMAYQPASEEYLPFQETTKRRRKHNIEEVAEQLPLRAFVFDILYVDGKSLIDTPLLERMEILRKTIHPDDILIPAPGKVITEPETLQLMLDDAFSKGLEGVVVKKVDSPYQAGGRNFNWVKLKKHSAGAMQDTVDCVVLGYIYGKGKRVQFGAGALLVGVYDEEKDEFVSITKIGTGLTDEEWTSIKERTKHLERKTKPARVNSLITPSVWVEPKLVIEVLADEITRSPLHTAGMRQNTNGTKKLGGGTSEEQRPKTEDQSGYALRFPRLVSFRDKDKKPEDATSVRELIEMYNAQGKKE